MNEKPEGPSGTSRLPVMEPPPFPDGRLSGVPVRTAGLVGLSSLRGRFFLTPGSSSLLLLLLWLVLPLTSLLLDHLLLPMLLLLFALPVLLFELLLSLFAHLPALLLLDHLLLPELLLLFALPVLLLKLLPAVVGQLPALLPLSFFPQLPSSFVVGLFGSGLVPLFSELPALLQLLFTSLQPLVPIELLSVLAALQTFFPLLQLALLTLLTQDPLIHRPLLTLLPFQLALLEPQLGRGLVDTFRRDETVGHPCPLDPRTPIRIPPAQVPRIPQ